MTPEQMIKSYERDINVDVLDISIEDSNFSVWVDKMSVVEWSDKKIVWLR